MTPYDTLELARLKYERLSDWEYESWPIRPQPPQAPLSPPDPPDGAGDRFPRNPRPMAPAGAVAAHLSN